MKKIHKTDLFGALLFRHSVFENVITVIVLVIIHIAIFYIIEGLILTLMDGLCHLPRFFPAAYKQT